MHNHKRECASTSQNTEILLSRNDLKALGIGVSNSTLLRWEYAGRFPRRVRMSGTRVAWLRSEISDWLTQRGKDRLHTYYADPD